MAVQINVARRAGHPWFGEERPGFDHLYIEADTEAERDAAVERAEKKFWAPWIVGHTVETGLPSAVLYKPCGIMVPWHDSYEKPHPGVE